MAILRHVVTLLLFCVIGTTYATPGYQINGYICGVDTRSSTAAGACARAQAAQACSQGQYGTNTYTWTFSAPNTCHGECSNGAICSGDNEIISIQVTCAEGETLTETGCAVTNPCVDRSQQAPTYAWYKSTVGGSTVEGSYCDGSCMVGINPAPTGTAYNNGKEKLQRYEVVVTAAPCTVANKPSDTATAPTPPEPPKRPLCDANEGVLTTTSGTIACVPAGVPSAQTPVVTKSKQTDVFPDGSTKTSETTYTKDPVSQVQDTKQVITNTPATGGGQGQAGPVGTSTGEGSNSTAQGGTPTTPDQGGSTDLCKNNPGLQICKGGMNEEATQKKVLEALQGDGDYSSITNANGDTKKAEADAAHQAHLDNLTNGTFDSSASSQKQSVTDLIGSWWEPVPMTGCSPYTATIGSRTWTLDICPTAEKISSISGYALWVFLAFGVLGLFVKRGAE